MRGLNQILKSMTPAAQIQASIELLDEMFDKARPADRLIAQYFRARRYIGSKDKRSISKTIYQVLRHRLCLAYVLQEQNLPVSARFLVAASLLQEKAELKTYFDGIAYHPKPFSNDAFEHLQQLDFAALESAPTSVQLNIPDWLAPKLEQSLGAAYVVEMQALNSRATTDIRVNLLKVSVEEMANSLESASFEFSQSQLSPWCIRFNQRVALTSLDSFRQGHFEIQDEGSQLLALASEAKTGEKVVDFCAGAGGKSLAMATMMDNKGVIHACDVHNKRLAQLSLRAKRAGVHNIRVHELSSEHDKWVKQHRSMADIVMIDAPCTGTGTWRRNPDSRWNLKPEHLDNLLIVQQSILQSASRLVKPGGRLLYATCSLLKEENQQQIEQFLLNNSDFSYRTINLPESTLGQLSAGEYQQHQLTLSPANSGTDGFYLCALQRIA